jgi:ER degradation enhancer, mannosidase alpha-like 1
MSLAASLYPSLIDLQATRDTMYLDIGKTVFSDLLLRAKVECGIAGIRNLRSNTLEDRMESFVLSETLKVRSQPPIR